MTILPYPTTRHGVKIPAGHVTARTPIDYDPNPDPDKEFYDWEVAQLEAMHANEQAYEQRISDIADLCEEQEKHLWLEGGIPK